MTAPLRRGACPTLAAPMPTGDGWLARLAGRGARRRRSSPGSREAARGYGNGIVEVTARGSLQMRGLRAGDRRAARRGRGGAGHRAARGRAGGAGAARRAGPRSEADPRPLAAAHPRRRPASAWPPARPEGLGGGRRRRRLGLDDVPADLRCEALRDGDMMAWLLSIGGDAAEAVPLAIVAEAHVAKAAAWCSAPSRSLAGGAGAIAPPMLRSLILRHTGASREPDRNPLRPTRRCRRGAAPQYRRSGCTRCATAVPRSASACPSARPRRLRLVCSAVPPRRRRASPKIRAAPCAGAAGAQPLPTPKAADLQALVPCSA